MTEKDSLFIQDILEVLQKHNKSAFVGTTYDRVTRMMLTTCLVQDGIKKEPFDQLEKGLADLVDTILGGSHGEREISIGVVSK